MICVHTGCLRKNRFLCFKCLQNEYSQHIEDCIQYGFVSRFIENCFKILEQILQLKFDGTPVNLDCFKLFFEKKKQQQKEFRYNQDDVNFVKAHFEYSEFAYNILSFSKQFINGFPQLQKQQQQSIISQFDDIFEKNCDVHLEELENKAQILRSQFFYEEAIRCCNSYLNLKLESKIVFLKAKCLHFLDFIDEAEEMLELAQELDPKNEKILISKFMLLESNKKFKMISFIEAQQYPNLKKTFKAKQLIIEQKEKENDLYKAMLLLNECINEDPENFIAFTLKGCCLFKLGRIEEAKQICQQVQKLYPKYYQNLILQLQILCQEDKDSELYELLELNKSKLSPINRASILTMSYLKFNQYKKVKEVLDEIPEYMRDDAQYRQLRSMLEAHSLATLKYPSFEQQKQEQNNNKSFKSKQEKLFRIIADFQVLSNSLKFDEALAKIEEGLQIDRTNLDCLKLKASILYAKTKFQEVREIYNFMKSISPNCPQVIELESNLIHIFKPQFQQHFELKLENLNQGYEQAQNYIMKQQYDEAIKIYKQILSIDVTQLKAQLNELYCHIQNKQIDYALKQIEDKLKYSSNCLKILWLKGIAMFKKQEFEKALKIFEEIEANNASSQIFLFSQANCLFKLKKYDAAMKIYESLCQSTSQSRQIQSLKMRIYKCFFANKCQDQNKINQIFLELLNYNKKDYQDGFHYGLANWICVILLQSGLPSSESWAYFLKQKMQNSEVVQFIYAKTMLALGKIDISIQVYDQILQQNPKYLLALVGISQAFLQKNYSILVESYKNQALNINSRAFDKEVQNEILISDLEDLFEKDSICILSLSDFDVQYQNLFSMINAFF